jgi:hypothetical protein
VRVEEQPRDDDTRSRLQGEDGEEDDETIVLPAAKVGRLGSRPNWPLGLDDDEDDVGKDEEQEDGICRSVRRATGRGPCSATINALKFEKRQKRTCGGG